MVQFSEDGLVLLNFALGFIMFSIALSINRKDFSELITRPKSVIAGLLSQFIFLPLVTFLLILILKPNEGFALGMLLVAACPGGNISNYVTFLSNGNTALSITLTSAATLLAVIFTPFNFSFYAEWYAGNTMQENAIQLSMFSMVKSIATLIAIPLFAGLLLKEYFPKWAGYIEKPAKLLSMLIFLAFVAVAFVSNYKVFIAEIENIFLIVLLHNALAFATGFATAILFGVPVEDKKTITVETGIQNSGLGLILIFSYFNGNSNMALIAAWWGVWHIISGFALSKVLRLIK